jgi:hypothetical protein
MNSLAHTMIKKGNYRIDVYSPERMSFIVVDSNQGYWTAFNTLGVSVVRGETKKAVADILRIATPDELNLFNNQTRLTEEA